MAKQERMTVQVCFRVEPSLAATIRKVTARARASLGRGQTASEAGIMREALRRGIDSLGADYASSPRRAR